MLASAESEKVRLTSRKLLNYFRRIPIYDHDTSTSQTDSQTDGRTDGQLVCEYARPASGRVGPASTQQQKTSAFGKPARLSIYSADRQTRLTTNQQPASQPASQSDSI